METFEPRRVSDRDQDEQMPFDYRSYKYLITSHTVYPDNDHGDYDENDEVEDGIDKLEDIIRIAKSYGIVETWESYGSKDFRSGNETFYHLYIYKQDGSAISQEEKDFITQRLKSFR